MLDLQNKIIEIETKLIFHEDTIDQLNAVIIKQQNAIDKLQNQIVQLNTKFEQEAQHLSSDNSATDEKPPHY